MMTKDELVELYNKYLQGELKRKQEEELWENIYNYSSSFLCYITTNEEIKQDIWEDLIYNLISRNDYFKLVKNFNQLRNHLVGKLKNLAKKYHKWEDECLPESATGEFQDSVRYGTWKVKHDRGLHDGEDKREE